MKAFFHWSGILLAGAALATVAATPGDEPDRPGRSSSSERPELRYLEAVNKAAPPKDPQLLFLLMAQYSNANRQAEGEEFFRARLGEFGPGLSDAQKALYLSAIGLLRAQHAHEVSLLSRFGYMKETIATLDQARQLSGGRIFVVNWMDGIVRAELPGVFRQRKAAGEQLAWCEANADKAPHAGWLREVYYHLGKLELADGDQRKAREYLAKSGYADFDRPITLATPFSEDRASGHTFAPRTISEVVPKRIYLVSGYEFTEYYFVVSDDRRELIAIDAGTRPDAAKAAYQALCAYAPDLPELTTVLVTHAHWDHVGGHSYFRSLNPRVRFYGRSKYQEELGRELNAPGNFGTRFFGERFSLDDVRSYKPDVLVDRRTALKIGGTRFELIPIEGGETHDAMFIHLPEEATLFVGDFIMPYLGAPFVEEGDFDGLLGAIDVVVRENPRHLLHGHEPLTRNFDSPALLAELKIDLEWLRGQVLDAIRGGRERSEMHQANLMPPNLLRGRPDVYQPYLILREHVIDRLYDQNVGYWQANLDGLDHLGARDRAELLVDYLGVSERQIDRAVESMAAAGKYELAASLLESSRAKFPKSEALARARRLVYLKLMEKNQNTDPFKFIIYSGQIDEQTPPMARDK
jgi:glyoxylase-like metal-dependent hydrolase (beta-lactamase superfamily II)